MSWLEYARGAWLEIRAHKVRSAMTCLSLAVGVAAILYTFTQTGDLLRRYHAQFLLAGPGRLNISAKEDYHSKGISQGLTSADADSILAQWPELYMVYPNVRRWGVRLRLESLSTDDGIAQGVTEQWRKRDWVYRLRGRFLNTKDVQERARVCVLIQPGGWQKKPWWAKFDRPQAIAPYLEHNDPIGKRILIDKHLYTVVGVVQEPPRDVDPRWFQERFGGQGTALVPITTFQAYLTQSGRRVGAVDDIQVDTGDEATASLYLRRIQGLLDSRHREPDYEIKDFRAVLEGAAQEIRRWVFQILVIGVVAILASGIGIMNVTLATIFSRVREIGIRRALGARRRDIVAQFVAEAMALGLVGGAAGTLLGAVGIHLSPKMGHIELGVRPLYVAASLAVAMATGFLFALYPAYKASRLDPIESLRYE